MRRTATRLTGAVRCTGARVVALAALVAIGPGCAQPTGLSRNPAVSITEAPIPEDRAAMVALGEWDALHRFFSVMGSRNPDRLFATRVIGTRSLTIGEPGADGVLAIWVRQRCQYRIPLSQRPVETALPCVFACRYPRDADDTTRASGCSFRIPEADRSGGGGRP